MAESNERLNRDKERRGEDRLSAVRGEGEATSLSVKQGAQRKRRKIIALNKRHIVHRKQTYLGRASS